MTEKKCACCGSEDVTNFHSKCCNAHFEGLYIKGFPCITCEKCGKFCAFLADEKETNGRTQ